MALQDLVDAASSGGAVELAAGSTTSISVSLTIDKPLTLFSSGRATITMSGTAAAIVISSSNVNLNNITINSSSGSGVQVAGSGNLSEITMTDCFVIGNYTGSPPVATPISGKIGIELSAASDCTFDHVWIEAFDKGIWIHSGSGGGSSASRNTFMSTGAFSCAIGGLIGATYCNDNRFIASRFGGCTTAGLSVVDASRTMVDVCSIESNVLGVIFDATVAGASQYNTINQTRFEGNTQDWTINSSNVLSSMVTNIAGPGSTYHWTDNGTDTIAGVQAELPVAATTRGSVTGKIQVYDLQGYTMGYLPLYGTIS